MDLTVMIQISNLQEARKAIVRAFNVYTDKVDGIDLEAADHLIYAVAQIDETISSLYGFKVDF